MIALADYDIGKAFQAVENELMESMIRNMKRHHLEEIDEGKEWEMWQALQLQALEEYKQANRTRFQGKFSDIDGAISSIISEARAQGGMAQEIKILNAIKKGFKPSKVSKNSVTTMAGFFRINDRKLDALIRATQNDFKKAEHAMLRMAEDQYRKVIFNAQVYANTGAGTYEKAVDMATKDFLGRGINCIEYANGARHTITDYATMAIKTASKRAYLTGEGEKRQEWGISLVIMKKRGNACPKCLPFVGKVLIDDVWSGGTQSDGPYMLMSTAIARGLYHPRCKDIHTTYFEGITKPGASYTKAELQDIEDDYRKDQKEQYAKRQKERFGRLARYSLDEGNQQQYRRKEQAWKNARFRTGDMDSRQYAESKRPLANFRAVPQDQVVDVLRRDSEDWITGLTDVEKRAIKKYTYNSGDEKPNRFFERLNAMLRGDAPENESLRRYADTISEAIKKSSLERDVICYRNMDIDIYAGYKPGDIFVESQFISTSVVPGAALNKPYKITIYAPKGCKGAYIEKVSKYPRQREFLLDKNNVFRVISKKESEIELEVIV